MTYDARERSTQAGEPVELYEFAYGSVVHRHTSSATQQSEGGNDYLPAALERSQIETSAERARNAITVTCPRDFVIAELFRVTPPTSIIALTLRRMHRGDADVAVIWMGRVVNCEWQGSVATLNCEPLITSLRRIGLRRKYQRQCQHVLYQQGAGRCNVVRATHSTVTTVSAVAGKVLSLAALGSKPWAGGFVEWETPAGSIERRYIESASGTDLTLAQPFQGITVGAAVTASPGCNHTMAMCEATYANLPNYGGFPFIPLKNPFDGTPVF